MKTLFLIGFLSLFVPKSYAINTPESIKTTLTYTLNDKNELNLMCIGCDEATSIEALVIRTDTSLRISCYMPQQVAFASGEVKGPPSKWPPIVTKVIGVSAYLESLEQTTATQMRISQNPNDSKDYKVATLIEILFER